MSTLLRASVLVGTTLILLTACGQATTTITNLPTVTPLAPMTMRPTVTTMAVPSSSAVSMMPTVVSTITAMPSISSLPATSGKVAMTTYNQADAAFFFDYPRSWVVNQDEKYGVSLASPATIDTRARYEEGVKNQTMPVDNPAINPDAIITYYPTIADEYANKTFNLGAKTLAELLVKNEYLQVIGDSTVDGLPAKEVLIEGMPSSYGLYISKGAGLYVITFPKSTSAFELTAEQRSIMLSLKLLK